VLLLWLLPVAAGTASQVPAHWSELSQQASATSCIAADNVLLLARGCSC
jgi:hypothetical protein